jgi:undecaprenyl-diphosphatase
MFLVVIQLGAILAVCVLYVQQLNPFARSKTSGERRDTWTLWAKIVVACIPAAVIGIPLDDWMEEHLSSPYVIAAALIFYGVVFLVVETVRERRARAALAAFHGAHMAPLAAGAAAAEKNREVGGAAAGTAGAAGAAAALSTAELADAEAAVTTIKDLNWGRALGIGCFQILSLVPGTSRSGSTIIGGLMLGCSRTVAAEFTFYLAIPVMVGASALRMVKFFLAGNVFTTAEWYVLAVGCVVAFVVSILAIKFLLGFIRKHDFKPFGVYRILLGVAVIAYFTLCR